MSNEIALLARREANIAGTNKKPEGKTNNTGNDTVMQKQMLTDGYAEQETDKTPKDANIL